MQDAHGRYHGTGWVIDLSADRLGPAARLVTVHEAWHDRLQFTTMYGLLIQVLWAVGQALNSAHETQRADQLLLGAARTHEEFASWMTEQLAGPLLGDLRQAYPTYAEHARRATERVGTHSSDYARMHAINAFYRACMQSAEAAEAASRPLAELSAGSFARSARPDHRLRILAAAVRAQGWGPVATAGRSLTVEDYANEHDRAWEAVARDYYGRCANLLTAGGCPTLPYEGQLLRVEDLHERAVEQVGGPIRLVPASASTEGLQADEDVVLRAMESETVRVRAVQSCTVLDRATAPEELAAGRGTGRHLFLAIRPAARLARLYEPLGAAMPTGPHTAVLRGTTHRGGQRVVTMLDVSDRPPADVCAPGLPIVTNISMRSLADDATRTRWAPLLSTVSSTVLVDLSPTRHLRLWLTGGTHTAQYALVRYQAAEREVTAVIWQLASESGGRSRLHIAVVSPTFPAALEVWIAAQPDLAAVLRRCDELADGHEELLGLTMGHLLAEEGIFDFLAGDAS
ncbi:MULTISPECIES: hypothetical protein [unclassified Modestobacter]